MKIKSEDCSLQPESKRIKLFTYFSSAETDEMDHFRTVSPLDREIKEYLIILLKCFEQYTYNFSNGNCLAIRIDTLENEIN